MNNNQNSRSNHTKNQKVFRCVELWVCLVAVAKVPTKLELLKLFLIKQLALIFNMMSFQESLLVQSTLLPRHYSKKVTKKHLEISFLACGKTLRMIKFGYGEINGIQFIQSMVNLDSLMILLFTIYSWV